MGPEGYNITFDWLTEEFGADGIVTTARYGNKKTIETEESYTYNFRGYGGTQLEVYDVDNAYSWRATDIRYDFLNRKSSEYRRNDDGTLTTISYNTKTGAIQTVDNVLLADLPAGTADRIKAEDYRGALVAERLRRDDTPEAAFDPHGQGTWAPQKDGFLAIDLGTDGKLDQARETDFSLWNSESVTKNPYLDGLRSFDSNHDDVLDGKDARWAEFRVWQDLNDNNIADTGELLTLDAAGIKLIDLMQTLEASGAGFASTGTYETTDGRTGWLGDTTLRFHPGTVDNGWEGNINGRPLTGTSP
jgi:hypothetical protein